MEPTESNKRSLATLASEALEKELRGELEKLTRHVTHWQAGEINSIQLNRLIQDYQRGPAKALLSRYDTMPDEVLVASAVAHDILPADRLDAELLESLQPRIAAFRKLAERSRPNT